ncbi:hypothetical protein J6590_102590, partial [Homalodisca vitripennis]
CDLEIVSWHVSACASIIANYSCCADTILCVLTYQKWSVNFMSDCDLEIVSWHVSACASIIPNYSRCADTILCVLTYQKWS